MYENLTGKALFDFLIKNKNILVTEKKAALKYADPIRLSGLYITKDGEVTKDIPLEDEDGQPIQRMCVINSCSIRDSHKDVHIPGIWKKSLSENKGLYLLEEHKLSFRGIITDDLKAFTKTMSWKSLGLDAPGNTEVLIFDATIPQDRNKYMYEQYKLNRVKQHSVGMLYVRIELAINDADYKEEFAVWNKYIDSVVNREETEVDGFFWAVTEAKVIEGSACPLGSNTITPTLNSTKTTTDDPPPKGTDDPPEEVKGLNTKQLLTIF